MKWFGRARKQTDLCTQGNKNWYGRTYKIEWLGRAKTNTIMFAARKENEMVWTRKILWARKNSSARKVNWFGRARGQNGLWTQGNNKMIWATIPHANVWVRNKNIFSRSVN